MKVWRRPWRVAKRSLAALALTCATALTFVNYEGTAQADPYDPCADGAYVLKNPVECGVEFPDPTTVTTTLLDTVRLPVTETTTVLVPTTEIVAKTEVSRELVPTTETVSTTITEPTSVTVDPATVTVPTVITSFADVIRSVQDLTPGPTETSRTTVTDRLTERVTDTAAPTWWNAPSINPQTGQRPGVSLSATQVRPGDSLTVAGSGGTPGETVLIELHSDPVQLGTATVDSDGTFETTVVIPLDTTPGQHTVEVVGVSCGVTTSVPLTVVAADITDHAAVQHLSEAGTLSYTGFNTASALIVGMALLGAGGSLILASRRRPAAGRHRF